MDNENKTYTNFKKPNKNFEGKEGAYKKPYYKRNNTKKEDNKVEIDKKIENKPENKDEKKDTITKKPYYKKDFQKRDGQKKEYYKKQTASVEPTEEVTVDETILFGRNSVMEVLKSDRDIDKILIQKGELEGSIRKIIGDAKQKGIVVQEVEKSKLDELTNMERHQGVVAYVSAKQYVSIEEILNDAKSKGEDAFILILENIQDPHNLGAIIRSAHNAGVHGIIIPKRRAVGLTATVSKASAGALEYMKIAKVTNISQTIEELKEKGIWVACADMDGEIIYTDNMRGPIGIVIGSEGEGISRNVKAKCDFAVSIPMYGKVTSLNASVAASIMVYEVVRQRHF